LQKNTKDVGITITWQHACQKQLKQTLNSNEFKNLVTNYCTWSVFMSTFEGVWGEGVSFINTPSVYVTRKPQSLQHGGGGFEGTGHCSHYIRDEIQYTVANTESSPFDIHPFMKHINPMLAGVLHERMWEGNICMEEAGGGI
jgi:hypothetical protein